MNLLICFLILAVFRERDNMLIPNANAQFVPQHPFFNHFAFMPTIGYLPRIWHQQHSQTAPMIQQATTKQGTESRPQNTSPPAKAEEESQVVAADFEDRGEAVKLQPQFRAGDVELIEAKLIQDRQGSDNVEAAEIEPVTDQDCCWKVKVAFTTGHKGGAYKLHRYIFGYYKMEPGLVNGRNHYTSIHGNGAFALAFCGDSWWLQSSEVRGQCMGWSHSGWKTQKCVYDIDYAWRYFVPVIDEFVEANKGLSVWCKS